MYVNLNCILTIGSYRLRGVHQLELRKSVHQLIQTATVQLPLSVVYRNEATKALDRVRLADRLKEGDPITIEIGYNGRLRTEFTGYVRRINYSMPLELECEDELYLLRRIRFQQSYKNISAKALLTDIVDKLRVQTGVRVLLDSNVPDVTIGNFYPNGETGVWILEELRKFGLSCYLVRQAGQLVLYAGLVYGYNAGRVYYKLNSNTVSHDQLKYAVREDRRFRVTVVNFKKDGTQQRETFGDETGDQVTINVYDAPDTAAMKQRADAEVNRLRIEGYKGTLETLLLPYAEPAMTADINDPQFVERSGAYYISGVTTRFGIGGARRLVNMEVRL